MMLEGANFDFNFSSLLSQELGGLALAPVPVSVTSPPPNILVNRVPEGFRPILINLQRCSRTELRRFLHNLMCIGGGSNPTSSLSTHGMMDLGEDPSERPLGRCGCELLEFDYQPGLLFGKRKRHHADLGEDDDSSVDDDSETEEEDEDEDEVTARLREEEEERTRIKIKRPPNSFMIYRSLRHNELVKEYRGGNKVISGIIAKEWHSLAPEKKRVYEEMAAAKKREHELLYPNYKFMPKRRK
ncbi:hypothetical protein GQ54DRAFT_294798 [Martensiomyces pterosporus]|nr:hypothetical protein GQ54DRAFT_294798 [Martensiomyces pterosporus]